EIARDRVEEIPAIDPGRCTGLAGGGNNVHRRPADRTRRVGTPDRQHEQGGTHERANPGDQIAGEDAVLRLFRIAWLATGRRRHYRPLLLLALLLRRSSTRRDRSGLLSLARFQAPRRKAGLRPH